MMISFRKWRLDIREYLFANGGRVLKEGSCPEERHLLRDRQAHLDTNQDNLKSYLLSLILNNSL